ncbi:uncharacterized protein MELLADRAFT_108574 [Melampsora larici-populina 98AG31]|uniref:Uncharacterized protein n=1 Tax=Melampsora larici-populina (strain 98AG31 / pathotype 3-4-7) TaxID=747676 RepID=F4RTJ2_MELLP|nr:uncharacterized protein MELLADRAFT_108574 [Melampsora larici-populina 98AG31]EGG04265.1 hypothetical protein MELLADRAFT_108574 [Melampsora larici-populina 98AG31]
MARLTSTSTAGKQQTFADPPKGAQRPPKRKRSAKDFVDTRFKFSSAASRSKKLKVNLSHVVTAHPSLALELEDKDGHDCHFSPALKNATLENLSIPFTKLYRNIEPITRSLPLLLHHKDQVIDACCAALTIQLGDEDENDDSQPFPKTPFSTRARNDHVQAEKEQKRKLLKARERVDLVASTVLDLLVPLIVDLSTALLDASPLTNNTSSFEKILTTLLHLINLPNPDPQTLEKSTQVIVHLFKTLAKDLVLSDEEEQLGNDRLHRIWQLARFALGAPSPSNDIQRTEAKTHHHQETGEGALKLPEEDEDGAQSDTDSSHQVLAANVDEGIDAESLQEEDELLPTTEELDALLPTPSQKPTNNHDSKPDALKRVFYATNSSTRRLFATSLAFLIRKKNCSAQLIQLMLDDLMAVESEEIIREGELRARKDKRDFDRKGVVKHNTLVEEKGGARVFAEGITWAITESCKTIDHRLHSRATEIISTLHACVKQPSRPADPPLQDETSLSGGVAQGALIALLHHTNAEHFESVLADILSRTRDHLKSLETNADTPIIKNGHPAPALQVCLQSLSVIAGVRQGSKIAESKRIDMFETLDHLTNLMANIQTGFSPQLYPSVTSYIINLLTSIKNTGEFLASPKIPLHRVQWPFMDDFLLPNLWPLLIARLTPSQANEKVDSTSTASLLGNIAGIFKHSLPHPMLELVVQKVCWAIKSVIERSLHFITSTDSTTMVSDQLSDTTVHEASDWLFVFANIAPDPKLRQYLQTRAPLREWLGLFEAFISKAGSTEDVQSLRARYLQEYSHGTHLHHTIAISQLIATIRALLRFEGLMSKCDVLLANIPRMLELWGWHRDVLHQICGLCSDIKSSDYHQLLPSFESVYPHLQPALISESASIRSEALEILILLNRDPVRQNILNQCTIIEKTPLLVEKSRDRQMHIRKLGIMVKSDARLEEDSESVDIAQRYIMSQLKVHFKPLWEESIKSLTTLNERFPASFWSLVWSQLELVLNESPAICLTPYTNFEAPLEVQGPGVICKFSNESQFLCTNLNILEQNRIQDLKSERIQAMLDAQKLESRLDRRNYEVQLLELLCHNPEIAQKHNKLVIGAYFKFCQPDEDDIEQGHMLGKSARTRLVNWLPLISKFNAPKCLYRSDELRTSLYDILADPDSTLRTLALECILIWKDGGILRHQEHLKDLMDSSKFRDTLLKLSFTSNGDQVSDGDRAEVIPVAIRILYGCMLMNGGRGSTAQSQAPRRAAILSTLKSFSATELDLLVDLMLNPLKSNSDTKSMGGPLSSKKQLGFLTLLGDVMKSLGRDLCSRWPELLDTVIRLITTAQSKLVAVSEHRVEAEGSQTGLCKKIRSQAIHRLTSFFKHAPLSFSFQPWIQQIFDVVISPRLPTFASESAQAPSALLGLFHTWSSHREQALLLVDHNPDVLKSVYELLAIPNVKQDVINRVFDILENLIRYVNTGPEYSPQRLLTSYFAGLLPSLAGLLRGSSTGVPSYATSTGSRQINLLSSLMPYITDTEHAESFCELLIPLLAKRSYRVPEAIQTNLLVILSEFLGKAPLNATLPSTLKTLSTLLETITTRKGRCALVKAFQAISIHRSDLRDSDTVRLIAELNSFSVKRLDEPDFERRLNAFAELNESIYKRFGPLEWEILIHHALYQIRDEEELSLRNSSALLLGRFFEVIDGSTPDSILRPVLTKVMLTGLKKALRSKAEVIRQDVLNVLSTAITKNLPDVTELTEMKCLLVDGDKEANFFLNVYHIQSHRRTRALRRLAEEVEKGRLGSKVIFDIFCPLLVHTLAPKTTTRPDPEVVNESVRTLGTLVKALSWSAYNAILQFYMKLLHGAETVNKTIVRVVVSILRGFYFNLAVPTTEDGSKLTSAPTYVTEMVSDRLIPKLIRFMEQQKEGGPDESLRIMMSEGVAMIATFLPSPAKELAIAGVVSSLAQILKSTHQETRQSARTAMANIAFLLPKESLVVTVKELRSALVRGPQVHVLAHVIYAILAKTGEWEDSDVPGEVVAPIMKILAEDLFGDPAKERQSKELKAKTKFSETRSSRSLESLQMLVSRLSSSEQLTEILRPFRNILESTRSPRLLTQLEESFRRLTAGVVVNSRRFDAPTVLKLVHTFIARNSDLLKNRSNQNTRKVIKPTDYKLVLSGKIKSKVDHYEENAHHFVSLGLDLFQALYRKGTYNLHEPSNLELIDPLVVVVGNTLYSHNSEVLGRGLRVMSILIKLPLESVEKSATIIVRQMLAVVSHIGTSESELSQVALKTLGTVIRDCKVVELTEKQLTALLNMIAPDLEDSTRQLTLFALLRGIMSKKFLAPELYDLMDRIVHVLVTAQAAQVREVCRSIYLQFLLDYPQGKGRLSKSLEFLIKNLSYEHESGRESVLDLLNAITNKIGTELVIKHADILFMGLVMSVTNESSTKCKQMSLEVVKVLLRRMDPRKATEFLEMLFAWYQAKKSQVGLKRTALQILAIYAEVKAVGDSQTIRRIHDLLLSNAKLIAEELLMVEEDEETESSLDWQLAYQTLQGLSKVYKVDSDQITAALEADGWSMIQNFLLYPHMWVRSSAARLLGMLFSNPDVLKARPLKTEQLVKVARQSSLQLRSDHLDEALALQIVKNLFFVLKALRERVGDDQDLQKIAEIDGVRQTGGDAENMSGSEDEEQQQTKKTICHGVELMKMVRKLSLQANLAHAKRPSLFAAQDGRQWSLEPISVLRCFAALINFLSPQDLEAILNPLMIPIYRILEDANIQDPQMVELQNLAREVQEFLRDKVGTTKFSSVYQSLRTRAVEKRHQRKTVDALKAINHPEASAKRKASRGDAKSRIKKRKQEVFARNKLSYGK